MTTSQRLPPLKALHAFEATGRRGSFQSAAEELSVTQAAVAQQVRQLEERLGFPLFLRQRRGLQLSERGRAYFHDVQRAFALLREATDTLLSRKRVITVSVTPTFAAKCLIPQLPAFAQAHPTLDLRVLASDVLVDFARDGVDLAVRLTRRSTQRGVTADFLFAELIVVASPALIGAQPLPLDAAALARYPLLDDGQADWPAVLQGQPIRQALHMNQAALAIDAALASQGVAMVNRRFVREALERRQLLQVMVDPVQSDWGYYLVMPTRNRTDAALAAVGEWLKMLANESATPR
ncbi:LysR substrate-binding domain-containing protein [Pseudomonas oryzihabitans]|uniref:LysR substrate-binding domain-containing protein n=1 Tax=Pseudomonas oryzihabitans TaxID=47885 RepID=UPI0028A23DC6|nr:LysR substrate-binding domain-containing protein [Pseudomonas oryzihabitans]